MKEKVVIFSFVFILIFCNLVVAQEMIIGENQTLFNETSVTVQTPDIEFKNFIPKDFNIGDTQFSIQIVNLKNETLSNIGAFVVGKGFSTYDVVPIDALNPGERGYILVMGNFKESGEINLTIRISQYAFYQTVKVAAQNSNQSDDLQKQEEEKRALLVNMSAEVNQLRENYSSLENLISEKKDDDYDISNINLDYLDKYIRDAQSGIFAGDVNGAQVSIGLAKEEYVSLKMKTESAKKISFFEKVKNNIFLFSAMATITALILTILNSLRLKKRLKDAKEKIRNIKKKK